MNTTIRPALVVAFAVLLGACVSGLYFVYDPDDLRVLIRSVRRGEELDQLRRAASRRLESKEQAVQELISQRCTLREALARLQELDREWLQELERDWPDCTREMRKYLSQIWSDPEYHYGQIADMVKDLLSDRPQDKATVLRRLEKDYRLAFCPLDLHGCCRCGGEGRSVGPSSKRFRFDSWPDSGFSSGF
jgi:hypothetical protein